MNDVGVKERERRKRAERETGGGGMLGMQRDYSFAREQAPFFHSQTQTGCCTYTHPVLEPVCIKGNRVRYQE